MPVVIFSGALVRLPDGGVGIDRFEGREHTEFVAADGSRLPAIDLTQHLQAHGGWGWRVEQAADRSVAVLLAGGDAAAIEAALGALFGPVPLAVTSVRSVGDLGEGTTRRSAPPVPRPAARRGLSSSTLA